VLWSIGVLPRLIRVLSRLSRLLTGRFCPPGCPVQGLTSACARVLGPEPDIRAEKEDTCWIGVPRGSSTCARTPFAKMWEHTHLARYLLGGAFPVRLCRDLQALEASSAEPAAAHATVVPAVGQIKNTDFQAGEPHKS